MCSMSDTRLGPPAGHILGIGVDLCAPARMERALGREAFLHRVFSPEEQALLAARSGKAKWETAAANFAAKEAFLKACGKGLGGFALAEIAVLRRESGAPYYALTGAAAAWLAARGGAAHLSLSHDAGMACAFTVLQGRGEA